MLKPLYLKDKKIEVKKKILSYNIDDDINSILDPAQKSGLTNGSSTDLHKHDSYYLNITNTASYTPSSNYHPSTKIYIDNKYGPDLTLYSSSSSLENYVSSDVQETTTQATVTKMKEFTLPSTFPTCYVKLYWEFGISTADALATTQIWKNGAGHSIQYTSSSAVASSQTDVLEFGADDTIELRLKSNNANKPVFVQNFRVIGEQNPKKYGVTITA